METALFTIAIIGLSLLALLLVFFMLGMAFDSIGDFIYEHYELFVMIAAAIMIATMASGITLLIISMSM